MRRKLTLLLFLSVALPMRAEAHTVSPSKQVVRTMGERVIAQFQLGNGRKDVNEFDVEVYNLDWSKATHAVALQKRLSVQPAQAGDTASTARSFSVMMDLGGERSRTVYVCTKSVPKLLKIKRIATNVNTRVCARFSGERF